MMAPRLAQNGLGLARLLEGIVAAPDTPVSDITLDSREVRREGAFLACAGSKTHGLQYVDQAVAAGAAAVLWEPAAGVAAPTLPAGMVTLAVPELKRHLGRIAGRFFGEPSKRMRIAGITGTNGKTTVAWLLSQALHVGGQRAGYCGTLGYGAVSGAPGATDFLRSSDAHTTPDCITVHRHLSDLLAGAVRYVAMEVSSHAMDQNRVDGVSFDTVAFTNLSRDHLDYHGTMQAYGEAKARLLTTPGVHCRVINVGDAFGRRIAERLSVTEPVVEIAPAPTGTRHSAARFVQLTAVGAADGGLELQFDSSWGPASLRSPIVGDFNAENLLAALAILLAWDMPLAEAVQALEAARPAPGRMEAFRRAGRALAVVDYAHSPDALSKALRALRAHCRGELWCVFGCGGDRDAGKRPMMGAVAAELADRIILTDDNPRTEDPQAIIRDIRSGIAVDKPVRVIRDRGQAIATALQSADAQDVVLIAGKGHEDYQLCGMRRLPFSDRAEVRRLQGGEP